MAFLYFASLLALNTAAFAAYKDYSGDPGGVPSFPWKPMAVVHGLFGGLGSTLAIAGIIGAGFAQFDWWVPPVALLAALFLAGFIYGKARGFGPLLTLVGFPVGVTLGYISLFC